MGYHCVHFGGHRLQHWIPGLFDRQLVSPGDPSQLSYVLDASVGWIITSILSNMGLDAISSNGCYMPSPRLDVRRVALFSSSLVAATDPLVCNRIALGFGLLFSPLLAKTFRVWKLYSNSSVTVFRISDLQLFIVIFIVMGIEVILATLLSAISGLHAFLFVPDPLRPVYNYGTCSSSTAQLALIGVVRPEAFT
jgi:hypothetical protein